MNPEKSLALKELREERESYYEARRCLMGCVFVLIVSLSTVALLVMNDSVDTASEQLLAVVCCILAGGSIAHGIIFGLGMLEIRATLRRYAFSY